MTQQRLKGEERCEAIRQAMREVFAEKGFEGTTTRELAKAAGVSEALLYRHFPSKQAMYEAMTETCLGERFEAEYKQILSLEPSANTLVHFIHFLISQSLFESRKERRATETLVIRSLLSDGEFVRVMFKKRGYSLQNMIRECLLAARKAGEAHEGVPVVELAGYLAKALSMGMGLLTAPQPPLLDVKLSREQMTESCVWFVLLGLGLKPEAIKRYYNPKALSLLAAV
jgi:AcrR family transcriptional regulator